MLLILGLDERHSRQNNLIKEKRLQIQIKVVAEFWTELKYHAVENIGDLSKTLLKYLRGWREKT